MGRHDERDPKRTPSPGNQPGDTTDPANAPATGAPDEPDPKAGLDREVGDLDDPDAVEEDGALPGRVGGGLAGG